MDLFHCAAIKHGLAFGFGAAIFMLTILLVSRQVIGFILSLLFLLTALAGALIIDRKDQLFSWHKERFTEEEKLSEHRRKPVGSGEQATPVIPADQEEVVRDRKNRDFEGQVGRQKSRIDQFFE